MRMYEALRERDKKTKIGQRLKVARSRVSRGEGELVRARRRVVECEGGGEGGEG